MSPRFIYIPMSVIKRQLISCVHTWHIEQLIEATHEDVMTWKRFPHYLPFHDVIYMQGRHCSVQKRYCKTFETFEIGGSHAFTGMASSAMSYDSLFAIPTDIILNTYCISVKVKLLGKIKYLNLNLNGSIIWVIELIEYKGRGYYHNPP